LQKIGRFAYKKNTEPCFPLIFRLMSSYNKKRCFLRRLLKNEIFFVPLQRKILLSLAKKLSVKSGPGWAGLDLMTLWQELSQLGWAEF